MINPSELDKALNQLAEKLKPMSKEERASCLRSLGFDVTPISKEEDSFQQKNTAKQEFEK